MSFRSTPAKIAVAAILLVAGFTLGRGLAIATRPAPSLVGTWVGSQGGFATTTSFAPGGVTTTKVAVPPSGHIQIVGRYTLSGTSLSMTGESVAAEGVPEALVAQVRARVTKPHVAEIEFEGSDQVTFRMDGQEAVYERKKN